MSIAEKLQTIAKNEQRVYEAGRQAEYEEFWNEYLQNGERTDFGYAFAGKGWSDNNFKPNRNMVVSVSNYMFHSTRIKNLKAHLEKLGITMDFSKCTNFTYAFAWAAITDIGVVDIRSLTSNLQYFVYGNTNLVNFEKLIVSENNKFSDTAFYNASNLEEIRFEGVIGQNGLNMQWSKKLSHDSLVSIIEHLSTDTSGLTVTLSKVAVNKAFETSEGANDGTISAEFTTLIGTRSNWTIGLA